MNSRENISDVKFKKIFWWGREWIKGNKFDGLYILIGYDWVTGVVVWRLRYVDSTNKQHKLVSKLSLENFPGKTSMFLIVTGSR